MSLRTRILALFFVAAVVPLLGLGALEYARATRALESMIAAQNARVAERVVEAIRNRAALLQSDLLLLSDNAETQRWLAAVADDAADPDAAREADRFLRDTWGRLGSAYAALSYQDGRERQVYQLGSVATPFDRPVGAMGAIAMSHDIRDQRDGKPLGRVTLHPVLGAMVPLEVLATGFGQNGKGMVIDRESGRLLYHTDARWEGRLVDSVIASDAWEVTPALLGEPVGRFRYRRGDTVRVASYVSLSAPAWTVVVSGSVDEFSQPFAEDRLWSVGAFVLVTVLATWLFATLLRRTTRSLEQLTTATAVVGGGDFDPALPSGGEGEVGRLTTSFAVMVRRVREMMVEIETSKQMAVLGTFAAQLSHEVRNPLTSIKLNLQKLERLAREGRLPENASLPLSLSLQEVARLDTVVRGVLQLGSTRPATRALESLRRLVDSAVATITDQATAQQVQVVQRWMGDGDRSGDVGESDQVLVDRPAVEGAFLNVFLNALQAMPAGGILEIVAHASDEAVEVTVVDSGPGVPDGMRSELFRPFYSMREGGTGLGLPLARRAVEASGGTLALADVQPERGAAIRFAFPRARRSP